MPLIMRPGPAGRRFGRPGQLHAQGVLTDAELAQQKDQILNA